MFALEHAKNQLISGFEFLNQWNYKTLSVSIETSQLLGDSLLIVFESAAAKRQIELSFSPEKNGRAAAISLFFCNQSGERFSLEDWVSMKLLESDLAFSNIAEDTEQSFLSSFCVNCRSLFESSLRDTVAGISWDAVPFDWKGYR